MKDINIYLYESLENERIDEGFKDFIRKFAITAAVATTCLSAAAKPPQRVEDAKLNKQIVSVEKDLIKFGHAKSNDEIQVIIQTAKNRTVAHRLAEQDFINKTKGKADIIKTSFFENEAGEHVVVIYYVMN
jgi:hypothetical protein